MSVSAVRTSRKKFLTAVAGNEKTKAEELLKDAQKLIDTAAGRGVLKRNTASRMKARLYKKYNALSVD
jgi:small subunit ribosomal protein S20